MRDANSKIKKIEYYNIRSTFNVETMPKTKRTTPKQLAKMEKDRKIALANSQELSELKKHPDRRSLRKNAGRFWKKIASDCPARQVAKAKFVAQIMLFKLRASKVPPTSTPCCGGTCGCNHH